MEKITAEDIMTKAVISVSPETTLSDAALTLRAHQFSGMPVVDKNNVLIGILTEYDLISKSAIHLPTLQKLFQKLPMVDTSRFQEQITRVANLRVQDVMNKDPLMLREGTPLEDIVKTFSQHHRVDPIPIVDQFRRVQGVISRADILKLFAYVPETKHPGQEEDSVTAGEVLAEQALGFLQNDYVLVNRLVETGHDWLQQNQQLYRSLLAALADSPDFVTTLRMILEKICRMSEWVLGEAWVLDPKGKRLQWGAAWHRESAELAALVTYSKSLSFEEGSGIPGLVWSKKNPIHLRSVAEDPDALLRSDAARMAGLQAAAGIPVKLGEDVVAVLVFFMEKVHPSDDQFITFVSTVIVQLDSFLRRKFAEDSAHTLRKAVESSADAIVITTSEPSIVYVNPAWERLNGYSLEEVRGKNLNILHSGKTPKAVYERLWATISKGQPFVTDEIINRRKDGTEYNEEITISPITRGGEVAFYIGVIRNVTERKAKEEARSELLSSTAHQLRSPLTIIGWNVEALMKKGLGQGREDYLKQIFSAEKTMAELVNTFLDTAKLEAGQFVIRPTTIDLAYEVERTVRQARAFAEQKAVNFEVSLGVLPKQVIMDSNVLTMALQNLLSNAIKYTPRGGLVRLELGAQDGSLLFQVSDSGCGIPQNEQEKVFTKFFRATNVRGEAAVEGTGLGLYIVKMAVEQAGGRVAFTSEAGKGSTFSVVLAYQ